MAPRLIVRADAGAAIGAGHVMRCTALAHAWTELGGPVTFVTRCEGELLRARLAAYDVVTIDAPHPDPGDAATLARVVREAGDARVVIDGYHFDLAYQAEACALGAPVLVLDDIGHLTTYEADLLLNQNIAAPDVPYITRATRLLGPRYAMLRPEFATKRGHGRTLRPVAEHVLVTLGAGDPTGVTARVCRALAALADEQLEARVVVGMGNPNEAELRAIAAESRTKIELLPPSDRMPELMAWADVAVCAGGSTCWELCFFGVPMIMLTLEDNQRGNARGLAAAKAAVSVGERDEATAEAIAQALATVIDDGGKRAEMSLAGQTLVDGKGAARVARALMDATAGGRAHAKERQR